jgi:hypothetical protein
MHWVNYSRTEAGRVEHAIKSVHDETGRRRILFVRRVRAEMQALAHANDCVA